MISPPLMGGFKPFGIPLQESKFVKLLFEGYEAIRLLDYKNYNQEDAAAEMNISRPTLTRIYEKARKTIAKAFVEGKGIFIEGGCVEFDKEWFKCKKCHKLNSTKKNIIIDNCGFCQSDELVHINSPNENQKNIKEDIMEREGGSCICLYCKEVQPHKEGIPCRSVECPYCGRTMIRKDSYHHELIKNQQKRNYTIAIPTDNRITISEHFGRASLYLIVEIEKGRVKKHVFHENKAQKMPPSKKHNFRNSDENLSIFNNCDYLLTKGIGNSMKSKLIEKDVKIILVIDDDIEMLIDEFIVNLQTTVLS